VSVNTTLNVAASGGRFNSLVTGTKPVWGFVANALVPPGVTVTLKFADGTYNFSAQQILSHAFGNQINITGNTTTPANCKLVFSAGVHGLNIQSNLGTIDGFTLDGTTSTAGFNGVQMATGGLSTVDIGGHMVIQNWDSGIFMAGAANQMLMLGGCAVQKCNTCLNITFGATIGTSGACTLSMNSGTTFGILAAGFAKINVTSCSVTGTGGSPTGMKSTYGSYIYAVGATTASVTTPFVTDQLSGAAGVGSNVVGNRNAFIATS